MFSILFVLTLAIGIYGGARKGAIIQLIKTVGYISVFHYAAVYYSVLFPYIRMLIPFPGAGISIKMALFPESFVNDLNIFFYNGFSYLLLVFVGFLAINLLAYLFRQFEVNTLPEWFNVLGGALMGLVWAYCFIFFTLMIVSTIPITFVQDYFAGSPLIRFILTNTPYLSNQIVHLWSKGIEGVLIQ